MPTVRTRKSKRVSPKESPLIRTSRKRKSRKQRMRGTVRKEGDAKDAVDE